MRFIKIIMQSLSDYWGGVYPCSFSSMDYGYCSGWWQGFKLLLTLSQDNTLHYFIMLPDLHRLLRIGQWNVNGLRTLTQDKSMDNVFLDWVQSMDIAVLTETHLEKGEPLHVPGYRTFQVNRARNKNASRGSGGVATLIKRNIAAGVTRLQCPGTEMVWLRLDGPFFGLARSIALGAIYEGPQQSPVTIRADTDPFVGVQEQIDKFATDMDVLLLGDMNARTRRAQEYIDTHQSSRQPTEVWGIEPDTHTLNERQNMDVGSNGFGVPFINLCRKNELIILNGRTNGDRRGMFTSFQKRGHSLVDYAVAAAALVPSIPLFVVGALQGDLSDHAPISMKLRVSRNSSHPPPSAVDTGNHLQKVIWQDDAPVQFKKSLMKPAVAAHLADIATMLRSNPSRVTIDLAVQKFTHILMSNTALHAKIVTIRSNRRNMKRPTKLWFDHSCEQARNAVRFLGNLVQKGVESKRPEFYRHRNQYKKLLKWKLRLFKRKLLNTMANADPTQSPDKYWTTLKDLKNQHRRITGADISLEQWVKHFETLLNESSPALPSHTPHSEQVLPDAVEHPCFDPTDSVFTQAETMKQIARNKRNKSAFLDNISSETLHYAGEVIVPTLTAIFNAVLSTGFYPQEWKGATLTPLHKKGDWEVLGNYRGIAVSSCLGKTMNAILNNRLADFMQRSGLAHRYQTGFEKGMRTTDNALTIATIVDQAKIQKQQVFMCFIDLTKAYDTVNRRMLFAKLHASGIGTRFLAVLRDMYTGVSYAVKYQGRVSTMFLSNRGLKQGDPLSPKLFNCFTADVMKVLLHETCVPFLNGVPVPALFFADDLVLMATTPEALQRLMNSFVAYCDQNKLIVNEMKSKTLVAGKQPRSAIKKNRLHASRFTIKGTTLEAVKDFSYLGVDFHAAGPVPVSNNSMTLKAERAQGVLASLTREAPVALALKLYRQLIEPVALYGTEIWAPYALTRTRNVSESILHNKTTVRVNSDALLHKFLKRTLGTRKRSINAAVMGETASKPLFAMAMERTARFVHAVANAPEDSLVHNALVAQQAMHAAGKQCWYKGYARLMGQFGSATMIRGQIRDKLVNEYVTRWKTAIVAPSRLSFYSTLHDDYVFQPYLNCAVRKVRCAFTRFRISAHKLRVERDRWHNKANPVPRDERICRVCDNGQVEDEFHIFTCPCYETLRRRYHVSTNSREQISALVRTAAAPVMWFVYHVLKQVDQTCAE